MNYDDKQPLYNNSEIALTELGYSEPNEFRKLSRQDLIKRITHLEAYAGNKAFSYLMTLESIPISFCSSIELAEMFGMSKGRAKKIIVGFHNTAKHRSAVESASYIYNLDGSVRMEMTEKLRHDMIKAKKR